MNCSPLNAIGQNGQISSSLISGQYSILNDVTIVGSVSWQDSRIFVGTDVVITIAANSSLTITHSHLSGCEMMWAGIVMEDGASLTIESDAMVEDAKRAVSLILSPANNATSTLSITNSIFNKNFEGVFLSNFGGTAGPYPIGITGTVFTCREIPSVLSGTTSQMVRDADNPVGSNLESPYINDNDYPLTTLMPMNGFNPSPSEPSIAIWLYSVGVSQNTQFIPQPFVPVYFDVVIGGGDTEEYNVIDHHHLGIEARHSNFTCHNTVFQHTGSGNVNQIERAAIRARSVGEKSRNTRCQVIPVRDAGGNYVDGTGNRFYNCQTGVFVEEYYETLVELASFRSTQSNTQGVLQSPGINGVMGRSARSHLHVVRADTFYNIANCIWFTSLWSNFPLANNVFKYSNNVIAEGNIVQPHPDMNLVTDQYVVSGIWLINITPFGNQQQGVFGAGNLVLARHNTITDSYIGVTVHGWTEKLISVSENTVRLALQQNTALPFQYGVSFVENWGTASAVLNTLTNTDKLIFNNLVQGFGASAANTQSIYVEESLNTEVRCNNVSMTERGLEFAGNTPSRVLDNKMGDHTHGFWLSNNGNIGLIGPQAGTMIPSDNEWLGNWQPPASWMTFTDMSPSLPSALFVRNVAGFNPDGFGGTNGAGLEYATSTGSIFIVANPPALRDCPATPNNSVSVPNPWGQWESVAKGEYPYFGYEETAAFNYGFGLYQQLYAHPELRDSSAVLDSFFVANSGQPYGYFTQAISLIGRGAWDSAALVLEGLDPPQTAGQNLRDYLAVFLRLHRDSLLTDGDSLLLHSLASQCAASGGSAVHAARHLFDSHYLQIGEWGQGCDSTASRPVWQPTAGLQPRVYPNPSGGSFTIDLGTYPDGQGDFDFELYDSRGVRLLKSNHIPPRFSPEISLPQGIYLIHLTNNNTHETHTLKLLVR